MSLNAKKVGYAVGVTWGIFYALCAVLFTFLPDATMAFGNYLFHGIQLNTKPLDFGSAIIGLVLSVITGFVIGVVFSRVYNYFAKK